ncbi:rcr2p [Saccharomyces arboricola H-6]|uniref:Rcr2p n=1 Tax=Saccharomyces arboricola (strain H-6 / AS 2.3317 / CBS 10644) TaxID=1160507 RepID=J8Q9Q1_SACAR|nr:rcr2p [Saccharomyces arboricola H-6]
MILQGQIGSLIHKRADDNNGTGEAITDDDPFSSSSWRWGRWIFFIFFIVAILILLFSTAKVNRRRRIMGQAPIRGTAWLTPPTYRQSEREYNGTQRCVEDYVPEYTETANENDLGFYDERGEFHPNGKTEYLAPPPLSENHSTDKDLQRPKAAVVRISSENEFDLNLMRPTMNNFANDQDNRIGQYSPTTESSSFDVNNTPARAKPSR